MQFNLEDAICKWRKQLRKHEGMEPGYIEELEANLRDRIDDFVEQGQGEEEAFKNAIAKSYGSVEEVADEYFKARTPGHKKPPWKQNQFMMLLPGFIKAGLRHLARKKYFAGINLAGLVIAMVSCGLIALYIGFELSYDKFHSQHEDIYRVARTFRSQDYSVVDFEGYYSAPREIQMKQINGFKNLSGVKDATHFFIFKAPTFVKADGKEFTTEHLLTTNTPASFFSMFDWQFIEGSANAVSKHFNRAVLTRDLARHYFGHQWQQKDLLGETILVEDSAYHIAGVIENVPENSHYHFNLMLHDKKIGYWGGRVYLHLQPGADPEKVARLSNENIAKINTRLAESELFGGNYLQPLADIHLHSDILYETKPPGNLEYLYVFALIGFLILLISLTNYTNLSVAMNQSRQREIAMRKVLGSSRKNLTGQFLLEQVIMALVALPISILLIHLLLPYFNDFMAISQTNLFLVNIRYFLLFLAFALVVGLLAGIYPALYISGRKISNLFRGSGEKAAIKNFTLRKGLITFQFSLLIGLCSLTFFINDQLNYVKTKDLGYQSEGIMMVHFNDTSRFKVFRDQLMQMSFVNQVGNGAPFARDPFNQTTYRIDGSDIIYDDAYRFRMDYNTIKAYGIETTIDDALAKDSLPEELTLINHTAAEKFAETLGVEKHELLGKTFRQEPNYTQEDGTIGFPHVIAGFFEDIHIFSLKQKVDPNFLYLEKERHYINWAIINFDPQQIGTAVSEIEKAYNASDPAFPFIYKFLDEQLAELYARDTRLSQLVIILSGIAFFIAVMGLLGLTAYLTNLRQKEISIRKVLGAPANRILLLLNKEYLPLLVIALLVAIPFTYWGVSNWLETFAYRVDLKWWLFLVAGAFTLLVTIITVSVQSYKATQTNPARILKEEQ